MKKEEAEEGEETLEEESVVSSKKAEETDAQKGRPIIICVQNARLIRMNHSVTFLIYPMFKV